MASPRFAVPQFWERRHNAVADKEMVATAAGDLGVEILARTRILDACCLSRHDTPEVALEAVRLLHQVAAAAAAGDLPAADDTTAAARRLFVAGYDENEHRSQSWTDTTAAPQPHRRGSKPDDTPLPVPPPAVLDLAADALAGLTQAYRDLDDPG